MSDAELFELRRRVTELERRVAALDGGALPAPPDVDPELRQLLAGGNLIGAIKRYREMTGAGLAEAKDAVEALQRGVRLN